MTENNFDIDKVSTAIKEQRFVQALSALESNLIKQPKHIECLYLASVCSRYLKNYSDAKKYLDSLLKINPDMGRAYQELGHLNRIEGNLNKASTYYRQACELNPALIASWNYLHIFFSKNKVI